MHRTEALMFGPLCEAGVEWDSRTMKQGTWWAPSGALLLAECGDERLLQIQWWHHICRNLSWFLKAPNWSFCPLWSSQQQYPTPLLLPVAEPLQPRGRQSSSHPQAPPPCTQWMSSPYLSPPLDGCIVTLQLLEPIEEDPSSWFLNQSQHYLCRDLNQVLPHDSSCWWLDHSHQPYPSMLESQSLPSPWLQWQKVNPDQYQVYLSTQFSLKHVSLELYSLEIQGQFSPQLKWFKLRNSFHKQVPQNPLHISSTLKNLWPERLRTNIASNCL